MSNGGIRFYKKTFKGLEEKTRAKRHRIMGEWNTWTNTKGVDIEWKKPKTFGFQ